MARAVTPEEQFLTHLALIDSVIAFIARRHGLSDADEEEFAAHVRVKCIEDDYRVFREFGQRSALRTYLTTVVHHLFLDYRNAQWGKWRPSTDAVRLGPLALRLEVLVSRDRLSFDEACEHIVAERSASDSPDALRAELDRLSAILPVRPARRMVGEEAVNGLAVDPTGVEAPLRLTEIEATRRKAHASLAKAMGALPPDDRFLLRLRFQRGMTVARIAELTTQPQKALYRKFEKLFAALRDALQADGVDAPMIAVLLADPDGPRAVVMDTGHSHRAGKDD
jgi:RNA polymerase sigma factor (sigma-70 family)